MVDYFIAVISIVIVISFSTFLSVGNNLLIQYKFNEEEKQSISMQLKEDIDKNLKVGMLVTVEEVRYWIKLYGSNVIVKNKITDTTSATVYYNSYYYKVLEFSPERIVFLKDKKREE